MLDRINFEILAKTEDTAQYVYIVEIQRNHDDYLVISHTGKSDAALVCTLELSTYDPDEADSHMLELLLDKFIDGYVPVDNGTALHLPGFKNEEFNRAATLVKSTHEEYRRLEL